MKIFTALFFALGMVTLGSCSNDDDTQPVSDVVNLSAVIDSKQEVPTNASTATGTMTGTYNKKTQVLTYTITYQGFTPVAGHFHQAAPGVNGGTFVTLNNVGTSPITGTATVSPADGAKILSGETYVNLHSQAYTGGEIRGNVTAK